MQMNLLFGYYSWVNQDFFKLFQGQIILGAMHNNWNWAVPYD